MNKEVKLKDYNREHLIKALNTVIHIANLDKELYFSTETKDKEGFYLTNYDQLSDLFYREMVGCNKNVFIKGFGCPLGNHFLNSNYCIAWYHKEDSISRKSGLLGPTDSNGYTHHNYIPDCIDNLIISNKLDSEEKLLLLERMMLDLLKLRSIHEYAKKVLA